MSEVSPRLHLPSIAAVTVLGQSPATRLLRLLAGSIILATAMLPSDSDGFQTARLAGVAMAGLLLMTASRPAWLVDLGPLTVIAAALWIKLVITTGVLVNWVQPQERTVIAATAVVLLVLFAPLMWLPRLWRLTAALALSLAVTVLLFADVLHFRFFGEVVSNSEFASAWQLADVAPSVVGLMRRHDALLYADIVAVLLLSPLYAWTVRRVPPLPLGRRLGTVLTALGAAVLVSIPTVRMIRQDPDLVFEYATTRSEVVKAVGVLPYHVYDVAITLMYPVRGRLAVGSAERERVDQFVSELRSSPQPPSPLAGVASDRNLIFIIAESLNAFPIGLSVNGQPVAPHLSALAEESLFFTNFYDQTHMGTTSDAEFASQQSLHPLPTGSVATRYASNQFRGLAAILADHGYRTMSSVGAAGEFWNMRQMHRGLGFQRSYFEDSFSPGERFWVWVPDLEFFEQSVPWMLEQGEPFMAYLLTTSNHFPFKLPESYQELDQGWLRGTLVGDYANSVRYFDRALGVLLGRLRETGLLDRSVVVVVGDHRANIGEHPELARLLGFPTTDRYAFWRARKNLPLLIRLPHGAHAGRRTVSGGHLDIAPTLLSLLGIEEPGSLMLGRDLTAGQDAFVAFREGGFVQGAHALVARHDGTVCYDTGSGDEIDCGPLEGKRLEAMERLRISDYILEGNLIPEFTPQTARSD